MKIRNWEVDLPCVAPGVHQRLLFHSFDGERVSRSAYIQAGLHADEHPGLLVAHHLRRKLGELAAKGLVAGRVVVCPFANPVGLTQRVFGMPAGRFSLDNGENFNRQFPSLATEVRQIFLSTSDEQYDSSRIKAILCDRIAQRHDNDAVRATKIALLKEAFQHEIVLDLHCDTDAVLHLYSNRMHEQRALRLASALNIETVFLEDDAGGQPFDEAYAHPWREAVRLGLLEAEQAGFCASIELRGQADVDDAVAEQDADGIIRFLHAEGLIDGLPAFEKVDGAEIRAYPLEGASHIRTPVTGVIAYALKPGDHVSRDQRIADVICLDAESGRERTAILSDVDGRVIVTQQFKFVRAGQRVALVAGATPLPSRIPGNLLNDF